MIAHVNKRSHVSKHHILKSYEIPIQNKLSHVKPKESLEQYFRTPFALSGGGLLTTPTQCCELWDGQGGGGQGDGPELLRVEMDWVMIYRVYSRLKLL